MAEEGKKPPAIGETNIARRFSDMSTAPDMTTRQPVRQAPSADPAAKKPVAEKETPAKSAANVPTTAKTGRRGGKTSKSK